MKPVKEVAHIGIAVKQIQDHLPFYEEGLGLKVEKTEIVKIEKVKVAFFTIGNTRIELLEPTNNQSPVQKFIDKYGEGIHHIALEVDNLPQRIEKIKKEGFQLLNDIPTPGASGSIKSFIHPQSTGGVLFELIESNKEDNQ